MRTAGPYVVGAVTTTPTTTKHDHTMNYASYEWALETFDENDDIIETDTFTSIKDLIANRPIGPHAVALVRNWGSPEEGVVDRDWAYVIDNQLPKIFETTGYRVPKKYHTQLAAAIFFSNC